MSRNLVIGYGEIGQAVVEVIAPYHQVHIYDKTFSEKHLPVLVDVLHLCFPWSRSFVRAAKEYIRLTQPRHVIVWSTVPIGTTRKLGDGVAHSPVEGVHPHLATSIRTMRRWVGANTTMTAQFFEHYFERMGIMPHFVPSSDFTEFLKLRSTAKYGINLVWTDYEAQVADQLKMDFELLQAFDRDYNALYQALSKPHYQRYILTPPGGHIGGHCIVPNAEILDDQYPDAMLKMIKEMRP